MIYFTADQHFDHPGILRLEKRPFDSLASMEVWLIGSHNEVVAPEDTVYHVGDFAFSTNLERLTLLLSKLHGKHVLIAGNHDKCSSVHKRWKRWERRYLEAGFAEVHQSLVLDLPALGRTLITHLPAIETIRSGDDCRYLRERPTLDGYDAQVCGHCHSAWRRRWNSLNVGVDVWEYTPVSIDRLARFWKLTLNLG